MIPSPSSPPKDRNQKNHICYLVDHVANKQEVADLKNVVIYFFSNFVKLQSKILSNEHKGQQLFRAQLEIIFLIFES